MAGGPVLPISAYPTSAIGFPMIYDGAGTTEDRMPMYGLVAAADISADGIAWHLVFEMPQVLPPGTAKLRILTRANATTGVIGLNIQTASVAANESPDDVTRTDEGSVDITTSSTADQYTETKLTITGANVVKDEFLHVYVEMDDSAHTIAIETGSLFSIIWE